MRGSQRTMMSDVELWAIVDGGLSLRSLSSCEDLWSVTVQWDRVEIFVELCGITLVPSVGSRHAVSSPRFLSIVWHARSSASHKHYHTNFSSQSLPRFIFWKSSWTDWSAKQCGMTELPSQFSTIVLQALLLWRHENEQFGKTLRAFLYPPTCNKIASAHSQFSGWLFGHIIKRPMYFEDILQPQLLSNFQKCKWCPNNHIVFRSLKAANC